MHTVVARFHHVTRDSDEIEDTLRVNGAPDAHLTAYVVAMTFDTDSHKDAAKAARDRSGATCIKVVKREGSPTTALSAH
jgi:hypothetical protein